MEGQKYSLNVKFYWEYMDLRKWKENKNRQNYVIWNIIFYTSLLLFIWPYIKVGVIDRAYNKQTD
jgi:hypothetical protein